MRPIRARSWWTVGAALRRARRLTPILPALFALAIQSLAIQSHVHFARLSMAAMAITAEAASGIDPQALAKTSLPKGGPSPGGDSETALSVSRLPVAVTPSCLRSSRSPRRWPSRLLFHRQPSHRALLRSPTAGKAEPLLSCDRNFNQPERQRTEPHRPICGEAAQRGAWRKPGKDHESISIYGRKCDRAERRTWRCPRAD